MSCSEKCVCIILEVFYSRQIVKEHDATVVPGLVRKFTESAWPVHVLAFDNSFHQIDMQIVERTMAVAGLAHLLGPSSRVLLGDLQVKLDQPIR